MSFKVSLLYNQDAVEAPYAYLSFHFPFCLTAICFIFFIFFGRYVVYIQFNVSSTNAFFFLLLLFLFYASMISKIYTVVRIFITL